MKQLTTHERVERMYNHKEADRVPIIDVPWISALARWQKEGMPSGADFIEFFDIDGICKFEVDNSPRFPVQIMEENERFVVKTTEWGGVVKEFRDIVSSKEFISYSVDSWDSWLKVKERMTPDPAGVPWNLLSANYKNWKNKNWWIRGRASFGFDITKSLLTGDIFSLITLMEDPELLMDMYNHELDIGLAMLDMAWNAGYTFDELAWDDDLAYKNTQFFSLDMYREIVKPVHKRAVEWAHQKGIKVHMHTCGEITPFLSEFIEIGLDGVNPLEVKAGVNPVAVKNEYGKQILLRGGFDPYDWQYLDKAENQIRSRLPQMMEGGGYIFSSDHSIPDFIDLETYKKIVALAKEVGKYN